MKPRAIALAAHSPPRFPLVCAPLVARDDEALVEEAKAVAMLEPDLIEWRVDFFDDIADIDYVAEVAAQLKEAVGEIPLLFTRRSAREGGEPIAIDEDAVLAMYEAVCATGAIAMADYEMDNDAVRLRELRRMTSASDVQLVLSFHDFTRTPDAAALLGRFRQAQDLEADVAKIAVMPQSMEDVLTLLRATLEASRSLEIPVVSMAMGALGAVTRVSGWAFGSAMTFAVGQSASAPGQMPIEDVAEGIALLRRAMGG